LKYTKLMDQHRKTCLRSSRPPPCNSCMKLNNFATLNKEKQLWKLFIKERKLWLERMLKSSGVILDFPPTSKHENVLYWNNWNLEMHCKPLTLCLLRFHRKKITTKCERNHRTRTWITSMLISTDFWKYRTSNIAEKYLQYVNWYLSFNAHVLDKARPSYWLQINFDRQISWCWALSRVF